MSPNCVHVGNFGGAEVRRGLEYSGPNEYNIFDAIKGSLSLTNVTLRLHRRRRRSWLPYRRVLAVGTGVNGISSAGGIAGQPALSAWSMR